MSVCVCVSQNGVASVWPFGSHSSLSIGLTGYCVGLGTSSNTHNASAARDWQKKVWESGKVETVWILITGIKIGINIEVQEIQRLR